jgi:hypothetical protein
LTATILSSAAARFEDRRVFELSRRPPEILFPGAKHSQDVKCLAVGPFPHVVSAFGDEPQHGVRAEAMDLGQIPAEQRVERGPGIEARLVPSFGVPH